MLASYSASVVCMEWVGGSYVIHNRSVFSLLKVRPTLPAPFSLPARNWCHYLIASSRLSQWRPRAVRHRSTTAALKRTEHGRRLEDSSRLTTNWPQWRFAVRSVNMSWRTARVAVWSVSSRRDDRTYGENRTSKTIGTTTTTTGSWDQSILVIRTIRLTLTIVWPCGSFTVLSAVLL